jgi:adenylate cyclase class 1
VSDRLSIIQFGAPGEEISFSDLHAIVNRFKKLHHFKREHIHHTLNPHQRQFLDALPLLLDMNDPALPGFVSPATPAGIFAYRPDPQAIEAARQINPDFNYQSHPRDCRKAAIDGLFLMGSVGSIAFTIASDMDIWLCHRSDLTAHAFDELLIKTRALEQWAASLHLEVHFYLINSRQFLHAQKMPVSADSSGETQHYLLLEEFYRTSVYIAGKALAWWLVPPEHENDYQNYLAHLLERRLIDADQTLDLGGLAQVPAHEFLSATQWHIYKALHSPYKSLLKLLLMECYASEYPNIDWLCVEIKRSVYKGVLSGPEVDPYVLIYRRLENYLVKSQHLERLALIRQFFYRKVGAAGGNDGQTGTLSSYGNYVRDILESWKWPNDLPHVSNQRHAWDIETLLAENIEIVSQLSLCYSRIILFTYDHIDSEYKQNSDMKLLARKLSAFFERKPGKIEIIPAAGYELPAGPVLSLIEDRSDPENPGWSLYFETPDQHDAKTQAPLYRRQTLIEILCWLTVNNFYRECAPIHCETESLNLNAMELSAILNHLDKFFKSHFDFSDSLANYAAYNSLTHSLLFVNIGLTPTQTADEPLLTTHCTNPWSHGASRECLVWTIDRVSISHWNEILTSHQQGIEGLNDCLIDIVNETLSGGAAHPLTVICQTPVHAVSITRRIEMLFADLLELQRADSANSTPRYLMAGGGHYFVFSKQNGRLQYQRVDNEAKIIEALRSPRKHYGSVAFGAEVLAHTPIPAIYRQNRPRIVQCFVHREEDGTRVYILDEKGSLYIRQHEEGTPAQLVSQYARFLHALLSRKKTEAASMQFYEIENAAATGWSCRPISFHLSIEHEPNPLIISGAGLDKAAAISVRWKGVEFTSKQYGGRLFETVRERIIEFRRNEQAYPVYITDLDLPPSVFGIADTAPLQTLQFLECKEIIETQLNKR